NAFDAKISFSGYPTLHRITQNCMQLPAFINASWEHQVDAEGKNPEPS
ncbi:MAG: maleylacetoacetate isomerase, partial [Burkholderiaceae bacterium]|nr:maleylacetoacetate isomerase [Burkholderiaceae bacterium]